MSDTTGTPADYEKTYTGFWAQIVENPDGTLNLDQVKRELHDYSTLIDHVTEVYSDVTGGRLSKPETLPVHVISAVNERIRHAEGDAIADLIACLEDAEAGPFASTAEVVALIRDITGVEAAPQA